MDRYVVIEWSLIAKEWEARALKTEAALRRLMDQPSPMRHITPEQRKELWAAYEQAHEALNWPHRRIAASPASPPDAPVAPAEEG